MHTAAALTIVIAALAVSGCGASTFATRDKAGTKVITLDLVVGDRAGSSSETIARAFARRVEDASAGTVRVMVRATHKPLPSGDFPSTTIHSAERGGVDAVAVPSRGWAGVGVETLLPLELPMLITSEDALDAVARDGVADTMLAGIADAGFAPLALVPDGLQFVGGYTRPLDRPGAFAGATVRAQSSAPLYATLTALGSRPSYTPGFRAQELAYQGRITGAVSPSSLLSHPLAPWTVTANLPMGAETVTLALTRAGSKRLDVARRDLLVSAAHDVAREWARTRVRARTELAAMCRLGLGVAVADPHALARLRVVFDRAAEVGSRMAANRAVVSRLHQISRRHEAAPVTPCRITQAQRAQVADGGG
jgi:hypothetical protein